MSASSNTRTTQPRDPVLEHLVYTTATAGGKLRPTADAASAFWHAAQRVRLIAKYVRSFPQAVAA